MTPKAPPLSCLHNLQVLFPPFGKLPLPHLTVSHFSFKTGPPSQKGFLTTPLNPGEGLLFATTIPLPVPASIVALIALMPCLSPGPGDTGTISAG